MTEVYTALIMTIDLIRSNLYVVRSWHCNDLWFVIPICAKITTETLPSHGLVLTGSLICQYQGAIAFSITANPPISASAHSAIDTSTAPTSPLPPSLIAGPPLQASAAARSAPWRRQPSYRGSWPRELIRSHGASRYAPPSNTHLRRVGNGKSKPFRSLSAEPVFECAGWDNNPFSVFESWECRVGVGQIPDSIDAERG